MRSSTLVLVLAMFARLFTRSSLLVRQFSRVPFAALHVLVQNFPLVSCLYSSTLLFLVVAGMGLARLPLATTDLEICNCEALCQSADSPVFHVVLV